MPPPQASLQPVVISSNMISAISRYFFSPVSLEASIHANAHQPRHRNIVDEVVAITGSTGWVYAYLVMTGFLEYILYDRRDGRSWLRHRSEWWRLIRSPSSTSLLFPRYRSCRFSSLGRFVRILASFLQKGKVCYRIAWKIQAIRLSGNVCTYVFIKIRLD